jgi:putative DNA primase/helicase
VNPQPLPEVECASSAVQKPTVFGTASTLSVQEDQGFEQDAELRAYRFAESIYWKSPAETKFYFFHLRENGVFLVDTRENPNPSVWVCAHLKVLAHVRDNRSEKWGKLVFFMDNDGIAHEIIIANSLLIGEGDEVGRMLVSSGLKMPPGRKALNLLLRFLTECNPKQRARCVERIGWHGEHFVLPGESFGASGEKVYFQADSAYDFNFNIAGSLDEWRTQVGTLCQGNTRLIMAVSAAFAPPLLDVIGEESGGFHFTGSSSSGKTTALRVAGSVWGGGPNPYIQRWRATSNGLEAIAEAHCDALLCLDELAQVDPREAGENAYMLANGSGKGRSLKTGGAKRRARWNLIFLSTGEISLAEHMSQAGKKMKAGQDVRMGDIPLPVRGMGLFEVTHGATSPSDFAERLSLASQRYYGTAIRAYIPAILKYRGQLGKKIQEVRQCFTDKYTPAECSGQVKRVAQRFALVAAAGSLATELGITGWSDGEAFEAVGTCFLDWLRNRACVGDVDELTAIAQIRAFIESHGESRFALLGEDENRNDPRSIINKAGYRRVGDDGAPEWLIQPETFKQEVAKGFNRTWFTDLLVNRGILKPSSDGRASQSIYAPDLRRSVRLYCITAKILEESA